jgi:hypothetical protein
MFVLAEAARKMPFWNVLTNRINIQSKKGRKRLNDNRLFSFRTKYFANSRQNWDRFYDLKNIFMRWNFFLQTHPPITKSIRFLHFICTTCFNPDLGPLQVLF